MSVDTVNFALTSVRLRILKYPEHYSPDGQRKLLTMCDVMRAQLMSEDIKGFDDYIDMKLACEPDATDYLLENLFEELNITAREELTAKLLEA
jgi:hypothetical protein